MALAKYFSKDLLAINRLVNTDQSILTERLNSSVVTVAFDENAVSTFEGCCGLELIIRILSRLYPRIKIIDLSKKANIKVIELSNLAKKINSNIEFPDNNTDEDVYIVAGYTDKKLTSKGIIIYYGSENWISKYSNNKIQYFGNTKNPFGCGIAASIVASNVFRHIFKEYLFSPTLDSEFEFSVYSLSTDIQDNNPPFTQVVFDDVVIVGIGAVGNGLIWALSNIENLSGKIQLVDNESISISNLQRYILFEENDEKRIKVEIAKRFFNQKELNVSVSKGKWSDYVKERGDYNIQCVAVGIDNKKDRIGIQSTLPNIIFNAFTEDNSIGITRHKDFNKSACLSCSYVPLRKERDYINEVADNCNISNEANLVKAYYNLNLPVDQPIPNSNLESLLGTIAKANGINIDELAQFNGMKLEQFYSDFVCGGIKLHVSKIGTKIKNVDAPLAFQSTMAGILLASELVKHYFGYENISEPRTDFYPLSPIQNIGNPLHRMLEKDITGRCICKDEDFIKRYALKWNK
jgi:hypothetical protein